MHDSVKFKIIKIAPKLKTQKPQFDRKRVPLVLNFIYTQPPLPHLKRVIVWTQQTLLLYVPTSLKGQKYLEMSHFLSICPACNSACVVFSS